MLPKNWKIQAYTTVIVKMMVVTTDQTLRENVNAESQATARSSPAHVKEKYFKKEDDAFKKAATSCQTKYVMLSIQRNSI